MLLQKQALQLHRSGCYLIAIARLCADTTIPFVGVSDEDRNRLIDQRSSEMIGKWLGHNHDDSIITSQFFVNRPDLVARELLNDRLMEDKLLQDCTSDIYDIDGPTNLIRVRFVARKTNAAVNQYFIKCYRRIGTSTYHFIYDQDTLGVDLTRYEFDSYRQVVVPIL